MALILAEEYLRNRDSADSATSSVNVNVNPIEEKGHPRSQVSEGFRMQITRLKIRSDGVEGVAVPLNTALLEGRFSP